MIRLAVIQGIEEVGKAVPAADQMDLLIDNETALMQFVVDQHVDVGQAAAQHSTDEVSDRGHADERGKVACIVVAVETTNGLAHGIDAVGKGQEWVYDAEEVRRHFNGVEAGCARNLDEGEDHRDAAAYVSKRRNQAIGNAQVAQAYDDCGSDVGQCIGMFNSNGQVADGHDECLCDGKEGKQKEAGKVSLGNGEVLAALRVYLSAEDDEQHERADPQREVDKERGHAGTVVLYREYGVAFHLCRGGKEGRHLIGVQPLDRLQDGIVIGGIAQRNHVAAGGAKPLLNTVEVHRKALHYLLGLA